MDSGRRAGLRAWGLPPFTPPSRRGGSRQGGWGKPREPTQGDTRRLPGRGLARGITDGYVMGEYRHCSQNSPVIAKGIWDLARAASQALNLQCPWSLLFYHYECHPDPDQRDNIARPANTWRRPMGGIAIIAQYNRWPGRNPGVERAVRLALQHRDA